MRNPEVATSCDEIAATEVVRQSTCMIRRMGPRKFQGKRAKTMRCFASTRQKTRCDIIGKKPKHVAKRSIKKSLNILESFFRLTVLRDKRQEQSIVLVKDYCHV